MADDGAKMKNPKKAIKQTGRDRCSTPLGRYCPGMHTPTHIVQPALTLTMEPFATFQEPGQHSSEAHETCKPAYHNIMMAHGEIL